MIKSCKWCGKKQEMNGKREFCPGEKCKNAWKYAKRTNKLDKRAISDRDINTVKTLIGQLIKVATTKDQYLRVQVDIPVERVNFNTFQHLNQKVVIGFVDEINDGKDDKKTDKTGKKRFFDDRKARL